MPLAEPATERPAMPAASPLDGSPLAPPPAPLWNSAVDEHAITKTPKQSRARMIEKGTASCPDGQRLNA